MINGSVGTVFRRSNVSSLHEGVYTFTATNEAGAMTSNGCTLSVNKPPTLASPLASLYQFYTDQQASVAVNATGTAPLTYTWLVCACVFVQCIGVLCSVECVLGC